MSEVDNGRSNFYGQNITVGCGRIIWVDEDHDRPSGWVLPGGYITQDISLAFRTARYIATVTMKRNLT